ncbi:MAG: hypothetical protein ACXV5U_04095 [Ilumatobacteraceae bacterium]
MNRRTFLMSMTVAPVVAALAACGDSRTVSVATEPSTTPATTPANIAHPTGPNDVVLQIKYQGGLVPLGYDFASTPALLVSGDGRIFTHGAVPAVFPGPLLPAIIVRSITEDGIHALLAVVQRAGLLATPPDYPDRHNVADASDTVLTISAAGATFVHSAYGLGIGDPETGVRKNLLDAVTSLSDFEATAGAANLGADQSFVAASYRLQARVVDPADLSGQNPAPTIVDWPAGAGISLADAGECARVAAAAIGSLFIDAKQNTYFKDGGIVYQLSVRGVLPGDLAC